jgi:hypothetical protein
MSGTWIKQHAMTYHLSHSVASSTPRHERYSNSQLQRWKARIGYVIINPTTIRSRPPRWPLQMIWVNCDIITVSVPNQQPLNVRLLWTNVHTHHQRMTWWPVTLLMDWYAQILTKEEEEAHVQIMKSVSTVTVQVRYVISCESYI